MKTPAIGLVVFGFASRLATVRLAPQAWILCSLLALTATEVSCGQRVPRWGIAAMVADNDARASLLPTIAGIGEGRTHDYRSRACDGGLNVTEFGLRGTTFHDRACVRSIGLTGQELIVQNRFVTLPDPSVEWTGVSPGPGSAHLSPRLITTQDPEGGLSWKRGLLFGALGGAALGVLAHLLVDSVPCDTCYNGRSAAEGTFPEFVLGFSVGGGLVGALIGVLF